MKPWLAGLIGAVVGAGTIIAMNIAHAPSPEDRSNLVFPDKTFFLMGDGSRLSFSGAVTGLDLAYPNNVFSAVCSKADEVCHTASVEQIGYEQIGDVDLSDYEITEWSPDYVVARSDDPATTVLCSVVTFHANLHTEEVLYVSEPVMRNLANQKLCPPKLNDGMTHRYKIEQPPFRRDLDKRLAEKKR